ncbi:hypothetical protein GCM10027598_59030 [Amycolatopsis oliviviridis]|uniref:Uncharacterized protein n=1 Tax=Amycolatopsis oliviviridis TaxID=1471590 RepID=A0ABQ3M042_9PSEU|nr:hypothetical protein [Amycolatopsis oliviviridis]GHH28595.1 hypothetical protein GCM10017790_59680 [Amycolatopsis oliviviridis]
MTDFDMGIGALTEQLVTTTRNGDHDYVADVLARLAANSSRARASALLRELVGTSARMIRARIQEKSGALFTFDVTTEHDEPVEVEVLPPGPRSALRALSASLNRDAGDLEIHSDLATQGTPAEVVAVLMQCLLWTLELQNDRASTVRFSCY